MKSLSETKALEDLRKLKTAYQKFIREDYEHQARSCADCPTVGACCLDAHFVNVHVSKLEAVAIREILSNLDEDLQREVYGRATAAIEKYDLQADEISFAKTFACPLFEKAVGCLVHETGKPAPCISHACYENEADLPPDKFQETVEDKIEKLNRKVYGKNWNYLPLPIWLDLIKPNFQK